MMNKIIRQLKNNPEVSDWRVVEKKEKSHQAFFVIGKLETTRLQDTKEYDVTVYVRHDDKIGMSTFSISHELTSKELKNEINTAVESSKFVFNKDFEIPQGERKRTFRDKPFNDDFEVMVKRISDIFNSVSDERKKFNAIEVFYNEITKTIRNSKNVNLSSTTYDLEIESIPSYDGKAKVEIYNFNTYSKLDYRQIEKDCKQAMKDVTARYNAESIEEPGTIDVLLRGEEVSQFFNNMINDFSYGDVYSGQQDKKIGDMVQSADSKTLANISIGPSTKAHAFDNDGVVLNKVEIIKNGQLESYYGYNQYASYLGLKPTGVADEIQVKAGERSLKDLNGNRHLEIISLSGIQIDVYGDYIGGEIRLAILHDGKKKMPVSGLSFSGSFKEAMKSFELSKETTKIKGYSGPKYMLIKNMNIM